ncbi:ATP-binding cassette domain-containing protein [Oligoflexia bacterium]|nr:ATP-binding cassette domain-containing protein [Oligoflexia bacterium]
MDIELQNVSKAFSSGASQHFAVDNVSWKTSGGEVFGLLGPNGAGKTTMIRMLLDIIRPDRGTVLVNGERSANFKQSFRRQVGYLPEERGLYPNRKVLDTLLYFARLKGVEKGQAKKRAVELLHKLELDDRLNSKISDLSKGMSQKVQMICALVHDPELVILDEPFAGLDPVNLQVIRELILDLKQAGKTIVLSTHMMKEVEALCDRIFMIHQGREVLYGNLSEIKTSYADFEIFVDKDAEPEGLECVREIQMINGGKCVRLHEDRTMHDFLHEMAAAKRPVQSIEAASTPIENIFIALAKGRST